MSDAPAGGHPNWYQRTFTTGRPNAPRAVRVVAIILTVLAVLNLVRTVATVALNLTQSGWDAGARAVFLTLNAVTLAVSALYLVLAHHLRKGRMWAWITTMVLLGLTVPFGGLVLLGELSDDSAPWIGLALALPALAMLLGLIVPRSSREFFAGPRSPGVSVVPGQPAPGGGPSWSVSGQPAPGGGWPAPDQPGGRDGGQP